MESVEFWSKKGEYDTIIFASKIPVKEVDEKRLLEGP